MKPTPYGPGTRSLHQDQKPVENNFNLIHALPYPLAILQKSDGCIVEANQHFYDAFGFLIKTGGQSTEAGFLSIDEINGRTIQITTPSGHMPQIKADVVPCRHRDQNCWLVTTMTVKEQKRSDELAYDERISYRDLVENLNDVVYTTNQNAEVTYVSPNITRLSGYHPSDVIGKNFVEFVHPDDLSERIPQFLKVIGGASQATEYRFVTKAGEIKWVRTSARPIIKNEQLIGVQGILVDITDRKEIEEALRHSEEKYRLLVQNAKDAIFVSQGDYIKFMNPSASGLLGYTGRILPDKPFADFIHPDDREMLLYRYKKRLRGEKLSDRVYFRMFNRDGDVRDVEMNSVLIKWEGNPAALSFIRDITVQNMMENRLRDSQKMEALGTMAGGIAHNFNNLLMGIHGNSSLTLLGLDPSAKSRKYLEKIDKLVESGSKLTYQLLEYARGGNCEVGMVDINHLVTDASETLLATKKQIQIRQELPANLPPIKADKGQIEQILLNLLINAADAMPKGGNITVTTSLVKKDKAKEIVTLASDRSYVLLKVSDCGSGIPAHLQDRIFEPFFTTKGLENGTGLGLSTAYGIVKGHNGEIAVESEINKGATFSVYLPVYTDGSVEQTSKETSGLVKGKGIVLLVDDEETVLEAISIFLENIGYQVIKAADGSEGLKKFKNDWHQIELVLLDLILPEISGRDLFYKLKEINPEVKVLLSSGFGYDGQVKELLRDGCDGFIQKPYKFNQLSSKIMQILSAGEELDKIRKKKK